MADFVSGALAKSTSNIRPKTPKATKSPTMNWSLFDERGRRKYLVPLERKRFLQAALDVGGPTASFCAVLMFSGARISEVLALTPERIDDANGTINFETLKRRKKGVIRAVPVPKSLLVYLDGVHRYRAAQLNSNFAGEPLWTWSRTTAWRRVKQVMRKAAHPEHVSKPKSLRHAFGAAAAVNRVPLTMIMKWLGHARLETTQIYTSLVGKEERELAQRNWHPLELVFTRTPASGRSEPKPSRRSEKLN
jgi:integrase